MYSTAAAWAESLPDVLRDVCMRTFQSQELYETLPQDDLEKSSPNRPRIHLWRMPTQPLLARCVQYLKQQKKWIVLCITLSLMASWLTNAHKEVVQPLSHSVQPTHTVARHLRLLAPTTAQLLDSKDKNGYNFMFCKSLLSALALGYPAPTLMNFNVSAINPFLRNGGTHLLKIDGIRAHLNSLGPEYDDDVVFMFDATDTWMQLPPEVVLSRYLSLLDTAQARLNAQYGSRAVTRAGIKARVFFSAQKGCGINREQSESNGCLGAPESSLPADIFGPNTDTRVEGERSHVYMRPRWVNSGFAIGTVRDMRPVFERAWYMLQNDGGNIGSDQFIFTDIVAMQEAWRKLQTGTQQTWWEKLVGGRDRASAMMGSGLDWHAMYNFTEGETYELGIALDDGSAMSQVAWSFEKELDAITHDDPAGIAVVASQRGIASRAALSLPADIQNLPLPFSRLLLTPSPNVSIPHGNDPDPSIPTEMSSSAPTEPASWTNVPLVTNLYTGQVPAMVHMCGLEWKARIKTHWTATWFFPRLRELLDAGALGVGTGAPVTPDAVPSPSPSAWKDVRTTSDDTQRSRSAPAGGEPLATTTDPRTGLRTNWYARTIGGGVLGTDRESPRYAQMQDVCRGQWENLLRDGKGEWTSPIFAR